MSGSGTASRLIIGTAGHVDHGKTALVRALTGVETDRLPEERARGISIELGFAPLTLPDGRLAAVVDVPGHERFLRTMVSGATGVDLVLLVVAADEGVMPQTREHLDICRLLGLRRGVVALTKTDLVEGELRDLAAEEVRGALRGTFLYNAPLVPCSSTSGDGLPELRAALAAGTADLAPRPADGPARLPIDRVFTVKGFGTVVTGTVASGRFQAGDSIVVLPGGARARLRALQVHGAERSEALAGERAAFNLAGLDGGTRARGGTVAREGEVEISGCVDVELHWLPICPAPLGRRAKLLFHALTTHENATVTLLSGQSVAPGATAIVRLHLERPVALLPGDGFVLRAFRNLPGHGTTVGGGRILRVAVPPQRRRDPGARDLAARLLQASSEERLALEIEAAGSTGVPAALLSARTGLPPAEVNAACRALVAVGRVVEVGRLMAATEASELELLLQQRLQILHAAAPLQPGVPVEALRTSIPRFARLEARVFSALIARLAAAGTVVVEAELIRHRDFDSRKTEGGLLGPIARALEQAALGPPSPKEMAATLGAPLPAVVEALGILVRRGQVVRLKADLFFWRPAVDELRARLRAFLVDRAQITPQEWKALVGGSRKYAIPLAEHFDAEKVTLRVGEVRRLRALPGAA
jgi:selenocysteine-specific elongation factor